MALEHLRRKIAREDVSPFREKIISRRPDGVPEVHSQPVTAEKFWKDLEDSIDEEEDMEDEYPFSVGPFPK